ncbi:MAG TPA: hypothetical protein VJW20_06920 [Candidatus Angelobacter sp.]|nr:hypothetical protein [Candidatus Angelobacter sp.]
MDTGTKPTKAALPFSKTIRDFLQTNWLAILLTIIGLVLGAFFGFWANEHFYVRSLEFRILEQDAEKRALEKDLTRVSEENRNLEKENRDLQLRLGIKPEQRSVEPPPEGITMKFTYIPSQGQGPDSGGLIKGVVEGLKKPNLYKIVIYAHSDRWYVQPFADQPLTNIEPNGTWNASTHLGDRYAALLVNPAFAPMGSPEELPPTGGDILASSTVLPER